MFGSGAGQYAVGLKGRLRAAVPDAIIEEMFLGPMELAKIFSTTALNVHPCLYDAYGMTIVEAASQGAPSLQPSLVVFVHGLGKAVSKSYNGNHLLFGPPYLLRSWQAGPLKKRPAIRSRRRASPSSLSSQVLIG